MRGEVNIKKVFSILLILGTLCLLSACAGGKAKTPPDLSGEWKQTNSNSDSSYQTAAIKDDTMEVYWVSDSGTTKSLYWAGTYVPPKTADEPYTWDSANDKEKTSASLLASGDDTKTFSYKDGVISYDVSAMGTTTTVKLEKQK